MGHKSLSIVIYIYIYKYMPRKNWLWHTAQFGYALNLFTMETLCLIDYLINGDSNGGIIRQSRKPECSLLESNDNSFYHLVFSKNI